MTELPPSMPPIDAVNAARRDLARISAELARPQGGDDPFAAAMCATRMPMIVTDPRQGDNPVVFANDSFCRLTGYARDDILGRNCRFLQGPDTDPASVARMRAAVQGARPIEIEIRNYRKDGEPFWNRLLMAPVRDAAGELAYFFASQVDVTIERERLAGLESHNVALMAEAAGRLRALEESESQLRFATRAARLGIWELDLTTYELSGSPEFKEMFWRDGAAPFTYADLQSAKHPDDRDRVREAVEHAGRSGAEFEVEYRVVSPDGAVRWLQIRAQTVRAADGTALRMAGVSLDVTERRANEQRLQFSEESLRLATGAAETGTWDLDLTTDVLTWSDRTKAMFGISPGVACSMADFYAGLHPDDREATGHAFAAALDPVQRTTYDVEYRTVGREDGVVRWVAAKGKALFDEQGTCVRALGTAIDITRRRDERERLRASEARTLEVLSRSRAELEREVAERTRERDRAWNNSQDLLVVIDKQGVFQAVNPAVTAILGWQPADMIGHSSLNFVHGDDHGSGRTALAVASDGRLPSYENRYRHQDGTFRWIEWVASVEGELIYASGRHVTAEKEAAAALALAEDQLRQAQKMEAVGQLTGGIAHDFNNLLTGIVGAVELVQRRVQEGRLGDLQRFTSIAVTSANRAAALTQRLLAFARRQPLDPKPADANRLVADMEDLLRRTLGPSIELEMVLSGGLWPTLCDVNQLESALLNLAINARDAMSAEGRLTVETANAHLDEAYAQAQGGEVKPGQYISISVTDTGIGMDAAVIARAFEPFFTTKPIGQGTGLGLSMLYGFIKQSGGHVRIYSEVGRGTTFKLYLPRFRGALDEGAPLPTAKAEGAAAGENVLVVDDEPGVRMVVMEVLAQLGVYATEAVDGASGLRVLQSDARIDLLITDVGLPGGLNGRQLADAARLLRPGLKVLFITGFAGNAAIGHGVLEHGMHILTKPFAMDMLADKVRRMIESD